MSTAKPKTSAPRSDRCSARILSYQTDKEVPNNGAFMDQGEKETTVAINKGRKEEKGR